MTVKFKRIDIRNYKSIIKASIEYVNGVWKVEGTNNDAFGSNGAGKSTALEALQQCLFNKTSKGTTLDTTINRSTGRAYTITVELSVNNGIETHYKIVNDRISMKITIFTLENDEWTDLGIKSVPSALSYIQTIIGLDFNSFIALTHITHSTVISMTDNLNDSNLLKVLLDFGLLSRFEKRAKEEYKESVSKYSKLLARKHEIESSLGLIETFMPTDTTSLYKELATLNAEASTIRDVVESSIKDIDNCIHTLNFSRKEQEVLLKAKTALIDNPICDNCGCNILDEANKDVANNITTAISTMQEAIEDINKSIEVLESKRQHIIDTDKAKLDDLNTRIASITNKIHTCEYNEHIYNSNKSAIKTLKIELSSILGELPKELKTQSVLDQVTVILKKGVLHQQILSEFCKVLNIYLIEFMKYVSIDYITVNTAPDKGSFSYVITDNRYNSTIQFQELSGGELTRTRLAILLAMLKTIQILTNTSINILVFDEALDTLDKTASGDLAKLFHHLVDTEDKFIAMVSHGEQLNEVQFRGNLKITKTNNITSITQEA